MATGRLEALADRDAIVAALDALVAKFKAAVAEAGQVLTAAHGVLGDLELGEAHFVRGRRHGGERCVHDLDR